VDGFTGRGLSDAQRSLQGWVRTLMTWRRGSEAIHRGKFTQYVPRGDGLYVYFRHDPGLVMVVVNRGERAVEVDTGRFDDVLRAHPDARGIDVLTGERFVLSAPIRMPAKSVRVIDADPRTGAR
jgi:hypothetical protein